MDGDRNASTRTSTTKARSSRQISAARRSGEERWAGAAAGVSTDESASAAGEASFSAAMGPALPGEGAADLNKLSR
jgi:hypothetical protein